MSDIEFIVCGECGREQADMGRNVACEECGALMPSLETPIAKTKTTLAAKRKVRRAARQQNARSAGHE